MARLESASRLRWPRRIMVSITSLRSRLAAAPSPSSPLRSRYSQAIWNESSRSWESERVMSKKPTRTVRVPCHLRFAARFPTSTATGSDRKNDIARASVETMLGRSRPTFPQFLSRRPFDFKRFKRVEERVQPALRAIENLSRPRTLPHAATSCLVGAVYSCCRCRPSGPCCW